MGAKKGESGKKKKEAEFTDLGRRRLKILRRQGRAEEEKTKKRTAAGGQIVSRPAKEL